MNYRNILIEKIRKLVDGIWTVPDFMKEYYDYYLEQVPGGALSESENTFFGLVQEKLDWVTENPDQEDKKDGYIDYPEYIAWLRHSLEKFIENEDEWYQKYLESRK